MTNTVRTFRVRFDNFYGTLGFIETKSRIEANNLAKKYEGLVDELINGKFIFLGQYSKDIEKYIYRTDIDFCDIPVVWKKNTNACNDVSYDGIENWTNIKYMYTF